MTGTTIDCIDAKGQSNWINTRERHARYLTLSAMLPLLHETERDKPLRSYRKGR